jgi:hypothetical protein
MTGQQLESHRAEAVPDRWDDRRDDEGSVEISGTRLHAPSRPNGPGKYVRRRRERGLAFYFVASCRSTRWGGSTAKPPGSATFVVRLPGCA